jgi:hypothetical protein
MPNEVDRTVFMMQGGPYTTASKGTVRYAFTSDTAVALGTCYHGSAVGVGGIYQGEVGSGKEAKGCLVTVEDNDARFAFASGASATVGHVLAAGSSTYITHPEMIRACEFRNAVNGSNAVLQITPEY